VPSHGISRSLYLLGAAEANAQRGILSPLPIERSSSQRPRPSNNFNIKNKRYP
jgi:hypothetical protein